LWQAGATGENGVLTPKKIPPKGGLGREFKGRAGDPYEAADLPISATGLTPEEGGEGEFIDPFLQVPSFREARALFEKQFLRRKLEECRGNVSLLAEKIGLERSHLYRKLKSYGLEPGK
jgi:DNA-binding NtrC family response regulator